MPTLERQARAKAAREAKAATEQEAATAEPETEETEEVPTEVEPEETEELPPSFAEDEDAAEEEPKPESSEPEPASAPEDLGPFVMLTVASYGPVKLNGRLTRLVSGAPILVTDPVERAALLSLYCFRPARPRDFLPPYSGPITTNVIRGGGLKDPQQI